jgi:hypothetical protein
MDRQTILQHLRKQNANERRTWVRMLGYFFTVAARSGYPIGQAEGSLRHLMGFNELQHRVYGYANHLEAQTAWGIEAFIDSIYAKAAQYGVENDFRVALNMSLGASQ